MTKILTAEREMEQSVLECRETAAQTLESARKQARRIRRRTEQRITALHERCARAKETLADTLQQATEGEADRQHIDDGDTRAVDVAVERVVASLISADHDTD